MHSFWVFVVISHHHWLTKGTRGGRFSQCSCTLEGSRRHPDSQCLLRSLTCGGLRVCFLFAQKVGVAWNGGRYITLDLTIMYHIDRERGQVGFGFRCLLM